MIGITAQSRTVLEALQGFQARLQDLEPPLLEIGEYEQEATLQRFASSTGPDGQKWLENTQATLEAYLHKLSGAYDKTGKRTGTKKGYFLADGKAGAKSAHALAGKKPLLGESKALSTTIAYQVQDNTLFVGSPMEYAAMQQFGGSKDKFPHLWGDIPARPFLGISAEDEEKILAVLQRHFSP